MLIVQPLPLSISDRSTATCLTPPPLAVCVPQSLLLFSLRHSGRSARPGQCDGRSCRVTESGSGKSPDIRSFDGFNLHAIQRQFYRVNISELSTFGMRTVCIPHKSSILFGKEMPVLSTRRAMNGGVQSPSQRQWNWNTHTLLTLCQLHPPTVTLTPLCLGTAQFEHGDNFGICQLNG